MSNELPWKRWTPDDLAPPLSEFTPAVIAADVARHINHETLTFKIGSQHAIQI